MKKNQILNLKLAILILGWTLTFQANILNAQVKNNAEQNFNNYLQSVILSSPQEIGIFLQNKDYLQQVLELKGTDRELAQQLLVELEMRLVAESSSLPLQKFRHESTVSTADESFELIEKVRKLNLLVLKNNIKSELKYRLQNHQFRTATPKFTINSNRTSGTAQDMPLKVQSSADFPEMKNGFKSMGFREAMAQNGELNLQTQQITKETEIPDELADRMREEIEKQYRDYKASRGKVVTEGIPAKSTVINGRVLQSKQAETELSGEMENLVREKIEKKYQDFTASRSMVVNDRFPTKVAAKNNFPSKNQHSGEIENKAKLKEKFKARHQEEMKERIKQAQEEIKEKIKSKYSSSESGKNFLKSALSTSSASETDSLALVTLYNATNGPNWHNNTNWLTGPVNTWYGATLESGRVTILNLEGNNLNGELPEEIGQLTNLKSLSMRWNQLTGNIPTEIGLLTYLEYLFLLDNQLSGTIPAELGQLTNLQSLELGWNQLSGAIPGEIGNLVNLNYLVLGGNQLSGSIPAEFSQLAYLEYFYLSYNQLSGTIPPELGQLSNLRVLELGWNQLSGSIPAEIGNLVNLNYLVLGGNQLSGSIPAELSLLTSLEYLYLSDNQLSGTIPPELGQLTNLRFLELGWNQLYGSIPAELGNLVNLEYLLLSGNQLSGSIPAELGQLARLQDLLLIWNQLSGPIPIELCNTPVQWVYLEGNMFDSESCPAIQCLLDNGVYFEGKQIQQNGFQLVGECIIYPPCSVQDSLALVKLYYATNGPDWNNNDKWLTESSVGTWHGVTVEDSIVVSLNLEGNNLSGTLPAETGQLTNLRELYLSRNQLSGNIPTEIGNLSNLVELNMTNNQLTGSIPTALTNLTNLQVLNLYRNQLKGALPSGIGQMTNLHHLNIYDNLIDILPDITRPADFWGFFANYNKLTFEDLEYNMDLTESMNFGYSPQKPFGLPDTVLLNLGDNYTLDVTCGGTQNSYQWIFQGEALNEPSPNSAFELQNIDFSNTGAYFCQVTNSLVHGLFLQSEPIYVNLTEPPCNRQDSLALISLYYATNGPNWNNNTNWLTTEPVKNWYGITTLGGKVTDIELQYNGLNGQLPAELGQFDQLKMLRLGDWQITGPLPAELGNLTNLEYLQIEDCNLSGTSIPAQLGNLTNLQSLYLRWNQLSGEIPAELGNLTNLLNLSFHYNQFTGGIPPELGQLNNLRMLELSYNQLSGEIPVELTNLTNLQYLALYRNRLTGGMPEEISQMTDLRYIEVGYNLLEELPDITRPANLWGLWVHHNKLTFEDIEQNIDLVETMDFGYSPQKPFGLSDTVTLNMDDSYTLDVTCGGTQNSYQWIFQGEALNEANAASEYELQNIDFSNSGLYFCQVTNNLVPGLILQSEPIYVELVEPPCNPQDSLALVALYNTTNGPNWNNSTNWLTTEPVKNWFGVTTLGGKVTEVQLNNNNLNGNLPSEIGLLDELTILRLNHNKITGLIPVELGNLTFLEILEIWNNLLTGKIPSELCQLENLTYLDLDVNRFTGSIPKEIGNLKNLITVYFSNNQLTGTLPEEISQMTLLQHFIIYNNLLDSLPDITKPANLAYLHLNNNKFAFDDMEYNMDLREVLNFGYIPQLKYGEQELIAVSLGDSVVLDGTCGGSQNNYQWYFEGNAITEFTSNPTFTVKEFGDEKAGYYHCFVTNPLVPGLTLQSEFKHLYEAQPPVNSLDSLILVEFYNQTNGPNWIENTNWLAGPVHLWHGITVENQQVTGINLEQNYLSGILPASLSGLSELNTLQLHHNALMGTIPTEFGNFTQLEVLELWDNQLEGTIPPELGNLSTLRVLDIGENYLTGSIPPELGNLSNLTDLWIYRMGINGAIPPELGQLSNLQVLGLPYCQLSGAIPTEIGQLTNLTTLYLYNNQLTGNIPEEIWNLEFLTDVGLFYNQLSGNLSATAANADSLVYLNLSNNLLEGQIPDAIWDTPRLRILNLGYNLFSGPITTAVTNADSLRTLYLNSNQLEGPIPDELWSIPNLTSLNLSNNPLGGTLSPLVANASYLTNLYLSGNQLSGELPTELANTNINYLTLMNNLFEGEIPEVLSAMPSLNNLRIDGNKFTGTIPESLLKKLQIFTLSNNLLDSMPNIDNPVNLTYFYSYNNFLTFKDLEYNMDMQVQYDHRYYPQNFIGKPDTIYISHGNTLKLEIPCGGSQNYYRWYKESVAITDLSTSDMYEKYNFSALDTGSYFVTVENPLVPNLILRSHPVQIYLADEMCTELFFNSGWNLFSAPVHSKTSDIKTLFQPLIDKTSLIKIQDEQGNAVEDWGFIGGWKNFVGDIHATEGYKIKVNVDDSVEVCGEPVQYPFAIPLSSGWNIMGYPQTLSFNATAVLQKLIDNGTLQKVQDEAGNAIEDWGFIGGWKNFIGDFVPGEGYKIKLSAADTVWIEESYPKSAVALPQTVATAHFRPEFVNNGVDHMNINIGGLPLNILQPGDELAVFDGNICVGAVTLLPWHLNSGTISIPVSASDDLGMPGFTEGNTFTLKLWSTKQQQEYELEPEILKGPGFFVKHESTLLSLEKYTTTGIEGLLIPSQTEINCYPNPFSEEITIEINLAEDAEMQVEVYNQIGQRVKVLSSSKHLTAGTHRIIWDGRNFGNKKVAPGMYYVAANNIREKIILID